MTRLKSTSHNGQSLEDRAKESKGGRAAELRRIEMADKENYDKASYAEKRRIDKSYNDSSDRKEDNKGKFI